MNNEESVKDSEQVVDDEVQASLSGARARCG
jgi:hypothetical protein